MSTPSSTLPIAPAAAAAAAAQPAAPAPFAAGSREHRAARWALFVGGFATFAMFHGPQPLLSLFGQAFALTPAQASGMISATAGAMAVGLVPAGLLAQRFGPKPVMVGSIALGALCCLLCAFATQYPVLLALRALLGLTLAGLPAVSSAYLAEELEPGALGQAIGLVIAGNAAGGMSSRLVCGVLADLVGWRVALAGLGVLGALAAFEFWRSLPGGAALPRAAFRRRALPRRLRAPRAPAWPAAAVRARAAADGQLHEPLQLPRLPARRGALRAHARGRRRDLPALRDGHVLVALGRPAGRSPGVRARAGAHARLDGRRHRADVVRRPAGDRRRGRALHLRLLRRALGGHRLGRSHRGPRQVAGGCDLPHGVLLRRQHDGLARRPCMVGRPVGRHARASWARCGWRA